MTRRAFRGGRSADDHVGSVFGTVCAVPRRMPRYPRGLATSLGGMPKPPAGSCCVCGEPPAETEVMEWTWSRQRVHDRCLPIWILANRGRRTLGAWIAPALELLLNRHGGRLCDSCLALGLSLSLAEAKQVVTVAASVPGFRVLPVECYSCGRPTEALCLVSGSSATEARCARCSRTLAGSDIVTHGRDESEVACRDCTEPRGAQS